MRVVFFGSPSFALPSLEALLEAGHEVVLVVSQPARPVGRHAEPEDPPVAARARSLGLSLWQPASLKGEEALARLAATGPDLFVVVAYGRILGPRTLAIPRLGCLNVHGSLLPRWRGASPVQAALLAGDEETGVSLMRMDEGMDTGPVYAQASTAVVVAPLSQAETDGLVHMREEEKLARDVYSVLGAQHAVRAFANIARAESTHAAAVKRLLDRYGVADPMIPDVAGKFQNADLQKLYDDLIAQGHDSLTAALRVGITIEKVDIADLQTHMQESQHSDIRTVYANLLRASQNHLRAFENLLARYGG